MIGILSRQNVATTIALTAAYAGKKIQILVENQGRINQNVMNDFKGLGDVKLDDKMLENWTITGFPLSNVQQLEDLIRESDGKDVSSSNSDILYGGPIIYHATFNIDQATIHDTYVNPTGWGKVMNILYRFFCSFTRFLTYFEFVLFSGDFIHQWIQFGTLLATCWPTNYIVFTEAATAQGIEFTHIDRTRKARYQWSHSVQRQTNFRLKLNSSPFFTFKKKLVYSFLCICFIQN